MIAAFFTAVKEFTIAQKFDMMRTGRLRQTG